MRKAAGAGVSWDYPMVMDIDHIETTATTVTVKFGVLSYWALHWAGMIPVINKKLWQAAIGPGTPANYVENPDPRYSGTFTDALKVREYHPWEHDKYNAATGGSGADGILDFKQDGSGPWIFESYVPGQTILFKKFTQFYTTIPIHSKGKWVHEPTGAEWHFSQGAWVHDPDCTWYWLEPCDWIWVPRSSWIWLPWSTWLMGDIEDLLDQFFYGRGNVNYPGGAGEVNGWYTSDKRIDLNDLYIIATSMPSAIGTWGRGLNQFNPDADVNQDTEVDISDLAIAGLNFGKKMG
jgi:hypothetical protein